MNVWLISAYDQPNGMSSRSYDLALGLTELGYNVTIFTNSYCHWTHEDVLKEHEKTRFEEINSVKVVWLKTYKYKGNGLGRGINMFSNFFQVLRYHKIPLHKPDVVVGPSVPLLTGLAAYILSFKFQSKFIFEIRDVWPIALVESGALSKRSFIYLIFRLIEKFLYKKSDHISSTLPYVKGHIESSGGDALKVTWIPNCMNGETKYIANQNVNFQAIYLGGFGQEHDVISIVKAAHLLQESGITDIDFQIYGNGPKKDFCVEEAAKRGITNITFYEAVPKSKVQSVLAKGDVLLACLIDSPVYRFGINLNKIYDYFLAKKPIIFSGNTPNDPVKESNAGISLQPENAKSLAEAIIHFKEMNDEERSNYGENGFRYAKINFSRSVVASKFEKLILS